MLLSLIPLLLVKPVMGLGPVEFDLELRIELNILVRRIGRMIGKQAFKQEVSIRIYNAVEVRLGSYSQDTIARLASTPAQIITPLISLAISVVFGSKVIASKSTVIEAPQTL
jgi:hypothetical protein